MKVHLIRTKNFHATELRKVYELLYPHPGIMSFAISDKTILFDKDNFAWEEMFTEIENYRTAQAIPALEIIVVITKLKNENAWFSAPNPKGTNEIFIDGSEWENFIYAEAAYPIAYEVIANVLQRFMFKTWEDFESPLIHKTPIGCINDFCYWKPDITYKLRTADICSDCLSAMDELLPDKSMINQSIEIIESLRKGMLFSKMFQKSPDFEEHLPFVLAVTKRKIGMTQQAYTKLQLLIEHFDSIVRTTVVVFSHLLLNTDEVKELFKSKGLNEHPSLGHWVSALKQLIECNHRVNSNLELPKDIKQKLDRVYKLYESKYLVSLRNNVSHGYTAINEQLHISQFNEYSKTSTEVESILNPILKRLHYYQIVHVEILGQNKFKFRVLDFSGSNASFLEKEIETSFVDLNSIPQSNKIYVEKRMSMSNNTSSIVSKVWSFCNPLRDVGVGYGDYLEQLTYLLFLKMADEYSKPPHNRKLPIPKGIQLGKSNQ
jgi:hypothetical protein